MAITAVSSCLLGPPPLPPGKRFLHRTSASNVTNASKKLQQQQSSTYLSFRDPAVEAWIPTGIVVAYPRQNYSHKKNHQELICNDNCGGKVDERRARHWSPSCEKNGLNHWKHFSDCDEVDAAPVRIKTNLFRSSSEGNLQRIKNRNHGRGSVAGLPGATPLDKCIKAVYGSWRNLMQRKQGNSKNFMCQKFWTFVWTKEKKIYFF